MGFCARSDKNNFLRETCGPLGILTYFELVWNSWNGPEKALNGTPTFQDVM